MCALDYVTRFATQRAIDDAENKEDSDSESDMSEMDPFSDDETNGMDL